nr:MAG TPA: hypothetical protein [Caudoviricetes sp.]
METNSEQLQAFGPELFCCWKGDGFMDDCQRR